MYSHRLGHAGRKGADARGEPAVGQEDADLWLVGGASNVGCAVLRMEGFVVSHTLRGEAVGILGGGGGGGE